MTGEMVASDVTILDLLRKFDAMSVAELARATQVTATAVRQRLTRLMAQGYIERKAESKGRGRPSHRYSLTSRGKRRTGANFADLAMALWEEIRAIADPQVRRGLIQRIARRMAAAYAERIDVDEAVAEKMRLVCELFEDRRVPFVVDESGRLPVLTAMACPYPELAEKDRSVCAMEKMMFSELLGRDLRLTQCRLDGERCCTFELSGAEGV